MPDTRKTLIHAAMELFAAKGYHSTSVADILRAADANSGSLYHYFPGKQDVLLAVLDTYHDGIAEMLLDPAWEDVEDPIDRVFALLGRYRELLITSDFFFGCPIGNIALEIHEPDPAVRERLMANFSAWQAAVRRCLEAAAPQLADSADAESLATLVLALMEGGVMLSRTYRSAEPFDRAVAELRRLLTLLSKPG